MIETPFTADTDKLNRLLIDAPDDWERQALSIVRKWGPDAVIHPVVQHLDSPLYGVKTRATAFLLTHFRTERCDQLLDDLYDRLDHSQIIRLAYELCLPNTLPTQSHLVLRLAQSLTDHEARILLDIHAHAMRRAKAGEHSSDAHRTTHPTPFAIVSIRSALGLALARHAAPGSEFEYQLSRLDIMTAAIAEHVLRKHLTRCYSAFEIFENPEQHLTRSLLQKLMTHPHQEPLTRTINGLSFPDHLGPRHRALVRQLNDMLPQSPHGKSLLDALLSTLENTHRLSQKDIENLEQTRALEPAVSFARTH